MQKVYISAASGGGETLSIVLGKRPELFTSALFISSQWDGDLNVLANAQTPLYIVIGENDSYYGSTRAINAYNSLHDIYENQGLSDEQIDEILVLDVKEHEYFSSTKNETLNYLRKQKEDVSLDDIYYIAEEDEELNKIIEKDKYNRIISKLRK